MFDHTELHAEQIKPLVDELSRICKENDIPLSLLVAIKSDEDGVDVQCTGGNTSGEDVDVIDASYCLWAGPQEVSGVFVGAVLTIRQQLIGMAKSAERHRSARFN